MNGFKTLYSYINSVTTGQGPELQCLLKLKEHLS